MADKLSKEVEELKKAMADIQISQGVIHTNHTAGLVAPSSGFSGGYISDNSSEIRILRAELADLRREVMDLRIELEEERNRVTASERHNAERALKDMQK
jgi:hypothetical protein